jgi:hypothetical protein
MSGDEPSRSETGGDRPADTAIERVTDEGRHRRVIEFAGAILELIRQYKDLTEADLDQLSRDLRRLKRVPTSPSKTVAAADLEELRGLSRDALFSYLNDQSKVPNSNALRAIARAAGVKGASRLPNEQLRQKIVSILHDRPREREEMLNTLSPDTSRSDDELSR